MNEDQKPVSEEKGRPFLMKVYHHAQLVASDVAEPMFVRVCGLEAAEIRWLHAQGLVALGDSLAWSADKKATTAYEDRWVVSGLTQKGEELLGIGLPPVE